MTTKDGGGGDYSCGAEEKAREMKRGLICCLANATPIIQVRPPVQRRRQRHTVMVTEREVEFVFGLAATSCI